jgi:hypothetical protein
MTDPQGQIDALFGTLRNAADPDVFAAIEKAVRDGEDRHLARINALAFAAKHVLDEEKVITAFLHASRLGLFEMTWNVLCPGCGGVLDAAAEPTIARSVRVPTNLLSMRWWKWPSP